MRISIVFFFSAWCVCGGQWISVEAVRADVAIAT